MPTIATSNGTMSAGRPTTTHAGLTNINATTSAATTHLKRRKIVSSSGVRGAVGPGIRGAPRITPIPIAMSTAVMTALTMSSWRATPGPMIHSESMRNAAPPAMSQSAAPASPMIRRREAGISIFNGVAFPGKERTWQAGGLYQCHARLIGCSVVTNWTMMNRFSCLGFSLY